MLFDFYVGILILFLVMLIPYIFFLLTLYKTLEAISQLNRKMNPGEVWLLFIPLFNFVWLFFVVSKISDSIADECRWLNLPVTEQRPTYGIGLAYAILSVTSSFIPLAGYLGLLVCWIIYWVKVSEYKKLIITNKDNFKLDAEQDVFHISN